MGVYQNEGVYELEPLLDLKLKACPFCGRDDLLSLVHTHTTSYWVECECGAQKGGAAISTRCRMPSKGELRQGRASAIEAWNTRAGS